MLGTLADVVDAEQRVAALCRHATARCFLSAATYGVEEAGRELAAATYAARAHLPAYAAQDTAALRARLQAVVDELSTALLIVPVPTPLPALTEAA